jgi:5-methylcytosine-specific restriction endonuclease McrA
LQDKGIGPGRYAGESIPARGPERDFTVKERRELNDIGNATGCHTCGTRAPGTTTENFVADHQVPSALNSMNLQQRLYPQCLTCSLRQGGWISGRGSGK